MSKNIFKQWYGWRKRSRYREVATVCLPLVMGMAATTVMEFTDRIFLSHYSVDAIAAVVPAGITAFLLLCFLGGISGYVTVFIAQYHGAGRPEKIGVALWQSLFFTAFAGLVLLFIAFVVTTPLFNLVGHSPAIRAQEEIYFRILCQGGVLHVAIQTLSGFFTGRGKTRPVMFANILGMIVNIPLDYALINGLWGLPEMGIQGAAIATVVSWGVTAFCLLLPVCSRPVRTEYRLRQSMVLDRDILRRLLKYGVPGALQFSLDIFAFTFFILMIGRMGTVPLAASNIAISISSLAFMPCLGFSFGISSLTGQALGRGKPAEARAAAWSSIHLLLIYISLLSVLFMVKPQWIVTLFVQAEEGGAQYGAIVQTASNILWMIGVYILFDAFYMSLAAVLKGAGDTRFLLWTIFSTSLICMVIPIYLGVNYLGMGIYSAWFCIVIFIATLAVLVSWRYRTGKWEKMLVIGEE